MRWVWFVFRCVSCIGEGAEPKMGPVIWVGHLTPETSLDSIHLPCSLFDSCSVGKNTFTPGAQQESLSRPRRVWAPLHVRGGEPKIIVITWSLSSYFRKYSTFFYIGSCPIFSGTNWRVQV